MILKIGDYVQWTTFSGKEYAGVLLEIDGDIHIVNCTDGVIRETTMLDNDNKDGDI